MTITTNDELFAEIEKITSNVERKTRNNTEASYYTDIYRKLMKIKENIEVDDFSIESKQACDMGRVLVELFPDEAHSMLAKSLFDINKFYQDANIPTLNAEQGAEFLLRRP